MSFLKYLFGTLFVIGMLTISALTFYDMGYKSCESRYQEQSELRELRLIPLGARVYYGGKEYFVCDNEGELVLCNYWKGYVLHVPPETKVNQMSPIRELK